MLDKRDTNEQLANEGWEKMIQLLDAEMPVAENRRKRPVFWLWSSTAGIAATLLLTIAGTWWIGQHVFKAGQINSGLVAEQKAAASESLRGAEVMSPEKTGADMNQIAPPSSIQHAEGASALSSAQSGLSKSMETPKSLISRASGLPLQATKSNVYLPDARLFEATEGQNTVAENQVSPALTEVGPTLLPEPVVSSAIAQFNPLPGRDFDILPAQAEGFPAKVIPSGKLPRGWRHGPEIGGITSFPTSLTGFHAGWTSEMPITDDLALHGALRYDFQRQTVSTTDRIALRESFVDVQEDPFNPLEMSTSPATDMDTVISSTLKMHYAAIPLSLSLKLNARWRVEGGVQVAYLLGAFRESKNSDSDFATTGVGVGNIVDQSSWYFSNKAQYVAKQSFQPWDLAISAGLRYQVARHWNVGISGNYGLLNQADKSNGYRIFNRNAVLSVGYYF